MGIKPTKFPFSIESNLPVFRYGDYHKYMFVDPLIEYTGYMTSKVCSLLSVK